MSHDKALYKSTVTVTDLSGSEGRMATSTLPVWESCPQCDNNGTAMNHAAEVPQVPVLDEEEIGSNCVHRRIPSLATCLGLSTLSDYTHNRFMDLFLGSPGWAGARRNLLDVMVQENITEADTLKIQLGATPSGLISKWQQPTSLIPPFYVRCPSCRKLPIYPGLWQAPNMLVCIPSGVVHHCQANNGWDVSSVYPHWSTELRF